MFFTLQQKNFGEQMILKQLPLLLFSLLLGVFGYLKYPDIYQPYFWDETAVYPIAAQHLADNGLSLLPGSIAPEYSRGHPLLFVFIIAMGFTLFGKGVIVAHSVALLISFTLLVSIYYVLSKEFNAWIALSVALLFSMQSIFLAQSSMVLPEVMVALTCWWSIYYMAKNKWGWFAIWGSLAILTKETCIVLVPAAITWLFYQCFVLKQKKLHPIYIIGSLTPLLIFSAFLVIQRIQNGWFLFPIHTGFIDFSLKKIYENLTGYLEFIFIKQHRIILSFLLASAVTVLLFKAKSIHIKSSFILCGIIFSIGLLALLLPNYRVSRYVLVLLPFYTLYIVIGLYHLLPQAWMVFPLAFCASLYCIIDAKLEPFEADNNMAYIYLNSVQTDIVKSLEEYNAHNDTILSAFPMLDFLKMSHNGIEKKAEYKYLVEQLDSTVKWVVYIQPSSFKIDMNKQPDYQLIKNFNLKYANGFIYRRKDS